MMDQEACLSECMDGVVSIAGGDESNQGDYNQHCTNAHHSDKVRRPDPMDHDDIKATWSVAHDTSARSDQSSPHSDPMRTFDGYGHGTSVMLCYAFTHERGPR